MFLIAIAVLFGSLFALAAVVQREKNRFEARDCELQDDVRNVFVGRWLPGGRIGTGSRRREPTD